MPVAELWGFEEVDLDGRQYLKNNNNNKQWERRRGIPRCRRALAELRLPVFGVVEADGKILDVPGSFSPEPYRRTVQIKAVVFLWSLEVLIQDLATLTLPAYFTHLTHWAFLSALLYLAVSLLNSLLRIPDQPWSYESRPRFMVCIQWGLFSLAGTGEIIATVLYWSIINEPGGGVGYTEVMKHGIIMFLVLVEGLVVNRVPVRMKHSLFVLVFIVVYLIFAIIHSQTSDSSTPSSNEYEQQQESAGYVVSVSTILVIWIPSFLLLWWLSLWSFPCRTDGSNRRYYVESDRTRGVEVQSVAIRNLREEDFSASVFSTI